MDGPLKNLLVVDLTRVLVGPYCTMILSDLGARVIKIEAPEIGDDSRKFGPFVKDYSAYFMSLNRGKESIALNLKNEDDKKIFDKILAKANKIKVDQASKKGDHIGPVISKIQYDKIINLIESGISEGATLAAGGPELPNGLNKGYFIKPTIFTDVTNEMRIAKEEIFGPVLSIIPFGTEDEAVNIVNDTSYGLGNYLQTEDREKAHRVAKKLRSGCVYINGNGADAGTPFGGYRQSGNGREGGVWGLEEYLEVKNVTGWS